MIDAGKKKLSLKKFISKTISPFLMFLKMVTFPCILCQNDAKRMKRESHITMEMHLIFATHHTSY